MFRKFFKRKEKENEYDVRYQLPEPSIDFNHAMDTVNRWLNSEEDTNNKIVLLDFILEVVKEDIKTDLLTTVLYSEPRFEKEIQAVFPPYFFDEHGNKIYTYPDKDLNGTREIEWMNVDLANDCVWVLPWRKDGLRASILNVFKNGFKYDPQNHWGYYFTHIDVCFVYNGRHSVSAGVVQKKGNIKVVKCDISRLFNHVYTDGEKWYNAHDGAKIGDLADFRIGIMYEVAKIKHNLNTLTD